MDRTFKGSGLERNSLITLHISSRETGDLTLENGRKGCRSKRRLPRRARKTGTERRDNKKTEEMKRGLWR